MQPITSHLLQLVEEAALEAAEAIKPQAVKLEQVAVHRTEAVTLRVLAATAETQQQIAAGAALDLDGCLMGRQAAVTAANHTHLEMAAKAEINSYVAAALQDLVAEAVAAVMVAEAAAATQVVAVQEAAADLTMVDQIKVIQAATDRMTAKLL
jgi:hypothetical protein